MKGHITKVLAVFLICTIFLSGCGLLPKTLSGKYVSKDAGTDYYIEFKGHSFTMSNGAVSFGGTYTIDSNDKVTLSFDPRLNQGDLILYLNKNSLYSFTGTSPYMEETFVKGTLSVNGTTSSGMPWWGWTLIIIFSISIIYQVISAAYKKVTKRDLEEDISKLSEKIDDKLNN